MSKLLHVCLYNTDGEASEELRSAIQALNSARLVAEAGNPEDLAAALHDAGVNLVFFHLDPDVKAVVDVIDQVATRYPELAMIAISHQTDPEVILAPIRAGCDQFVCAPIDTADLAAAVGRVASKRLLTKKKNCCVAITSASGGAGATSIACNLALEIGQLTEQDCALVDLDLQFGDVTVNFDSEPKYTIYDLATSATDLDRSMLESTLTVLPCRVAFLARPELLEQQAEIGPDAIHRVIELLMANYENVVIDVPRNVTPVSAVALGLADHVFIVCQLLVPSIRNAKRYFDALQRIGVPDERIEVIVNRSDGRGDRVSVRDIEETIRKPVFACIPNDYQFVARAIDLGRPIAALDRNSPVRSEIRKIARKIIADPSEATQKVDRKGFLSRLLTK